MQIHRLGLLSLTLASGCLGVWPGDWQAWQDEHGEDPIDTEPATDCAEGDADCDGYGAAEDCDDADPAINPGADEVPYDAIDQDCDGLDLTDVDGDGFDASEVGGDDCDDGAAEVHPDAMEIPCNTVDEDCNGTMIQDGMTASFAAGSMGPSAVELAWDPAARRVLAFFVAEDDGSCSAPTLRYRTFDEGLNILMDQDITPAGGLSTGGALAASADATGAPRLVAGNACDDSLLLLAPSTADETSWEAAALATRAGTVSAVDSCTASGDELWVAMVADGALGFGSPDGASTTWTTATGLAGDAQGVSLACASATQAALATGDANGLVTLDFTLSSGAFSAPQTLHAGAGAPQGGAGPDGEPWALFFEDAGADVLGYAWQGDGGSAWAQAVIPGVHAGTGLSDSGAAVTQDGFALLALIDGGGFHLRRVELSTGLSSTWSDTSLERSYADVVVDDLDRAWYLYGSASAYKVGVLCPE